MSIDESIKLFCENLDLAHPANKDEYDAIITRMLNVGFITQAELISETKKRGSEEPL